MYHLGQCLARTNNKPWLTYPSLGFVCPKYRSMDFGKKHFASFKYGFHKSDISVSYTMGTFNNYLKYSKRHVGDWVRVVDSVKYADLELTMQDGINVFEPLKQLDGFTVIEH